MLKYGGRKNGGWSPLTWPDLHHHSDPQRMPASNEPTPRRQQPSQKPSPERQARTARLEQELRANLAKRKAAARQRAQADGDPAVGDDENQ